MDPEIRDAFERLAADLDPLRRRRDARLRRPRRTDHRTRGARARSRGARLDPGRRPHAASITPAARASSGLSVPLHDLAESDAQVAPCAAEVRMYREGAPEELSRLLELSQHEVAEPLARQGPEVVRIAREGLPTVRDGGSV